MAQTVNNLPATQETLFGSLVRKILWRRKWQSTLVAIFTLVRHIGRLQHGWNRTKNVLQSWGLDLAPSQGGIPHERIEGWVR